MEFLMEETKLFMEETELLHRELLLLYIADTPLDRILLWYDYSTNPHLKTNAYKLYLQDREKLKLDSEYDFLESINTHFASQAATKHLEPLNEIELAELSSFLFYFSFCQTLLSVPLEKLLEHVTYKSPSKSTLIQLQDEREFSELVYKLAILVKAPNGEEYHRIHEDEQDYRSSSAEERWRKKLNSISQKTYEAESFDEVGYYLNPLRETKIGFSQEIWPDRQNILAPLEDWESGELGGLLVYSMFSKEHLQRAKQIIDSKAPMEVFFGILEKAGRSVQEQRAVRICVALMKMESLCYASYNTTREALIDQTYIWLVHAEEKKFRKKERNKLRNFFNTSPAMVLAFENGVANLRLKSSSHSLENTPMNNRSYKITLEDRKRKVFDLANKARRRELIEEIKTTFVEKTSKPSFDDISLKEFEEMTSLSRAVYYKIKNYSHNTMEGSRQLTLSTLLNLAWALKLNFLETQSWLLKAGYNVSASNTEDDVLAAIVYLLALNDFEKYTKTELNDILEEDGEFGLIWDVKKYGSFPPYKNKQKN